MSFHSTTSSSHSFINKQEKMELVEISSFETSTAIIERTGWKLQSPIPWKYLEEDGAKDFIRVPPQRDKRKLLDKNLFRLLLVHYNDMKELYRQNSLIETAKKHGWIGEKYNLFIKHSTAGSAVLESVDSIGIIAQAPNDDDFPFFSFCLTNRVADGPQGSSDWVCLLFTGPGISREEVARLLCSETFPHDYPEPLLPDFSIVPVVLLRWQVENITNELACIRKEVVRQDEELVFRSIEDFSKIRTELFIMRKKHLMLHRRRLFALEFAGNLMQFFRRIERRNTGEDDPVSYSTTLWDYVKAESAILEAVLHDIDAIGMRLQSQQAMIDNQTSIMIAKNSTVSAEKARRDSASMRIIALATLIFLPGTFVASIFSMAIFKWDANAEIGEKVVTKYAWLYFVIAAGLTIMVLLLYWLWSARSHRKHKEVEALKMV